MEFAQFADIAYIVSDFKFNILEKSPKAKDIIDDDYIDNLKFVFSEKILDTCSMVAKTGESSQFVSAIDNIYYNFKISAYGAFLIVVLTVFEEKIDTENHYDAIINSVSRSLIISANMENNEQASMIKHDMYKILSDINILKHKESMPESLDINYDRYSIKAFFDNMNTEFRKHFEDFFLTVYCESKWEFAIDREKFKAAIYNILSNLTNTKEVIVNVKNDNEIVRIDIFTNGVEMDTQYAKQIVLAHGGNLVEMADKIIINIPNLIVHEGYLYQRNQGKRTFEGVDIFLREFSKVLDDSEY